MNNLILAAFTTLPLITAFAPVADAAVSRKGSTVAGDAAARRIQQTGWKSE